MAMSVKNSREVAKMREAGRVVSVIHERIERAIAPGITTGDLDGIARQTLAELGATSSFLGYGGGPGRRPFPGHICASVNDVIVHGIPGKRVLKEGDIISVDVGAILNGYHGDSAWTYPVGAIAPEARRLLEDTEASLYRAVAAARAGARLGAVGAAVERFAVPLGYGLVREYGGHGIGRSMHEDPHVPNHGDPTRGVLLRSGLTLAIEPMLTTGGAEWRELNDGWTVVTADGSLAAHFEHTVVVTGTGGEILTERLPVPVQ
ncbi:MAG TPA: type I methionyl aminopeptidase [Thermomicrobiales bacterium]|nr:type I methionyl aminopeptidase [Thermomicrobiales bacterium]